MTDGPRVTLHKAHLAGKASRSHDRNPYEGRMDPLGSLARVVWQGGRIIAGAAALPDDPDHDGDNDEKPDTDDAAPAAAAPASATPA